MATLTTLVNFNGSDGSIPEAGLIINSAGDLFGTTTGGGSAFGGTVFEIVKTNTGYASTPTILVSFDGGNGTDPQAGLIADAGGNLFGTTYHGGASYGPGNNGYGTVFEIPKNAGTFANTPITLLNFNGPLFGVNGTNPSYNGEYPAAGLIADTAGNLFGEADGAVFEIAKTSTGYASAAKLLANNGGSEGSLFIDAAGNLIGTISGGGAYGYGSVFEIAKVGTAYANTPTTLVSFNSTNGAIPEAALVADAAGNLFGTTTEGGAYGDGTVFEIAKTGTGYASTPTTLVSFNGSDGQWPAAGLIIDAAGNIFGTTEEGGKNGSGTVFEVAKIGSGYATAPTILTNFDIGGSGPVGGVVNDAAGNLFGTTYTGGDGDGTVFELSGTGFQVSGTVVTTPVVVTNTSGTQETLVAPLANTTVQGGGYDILNLSQNPIATASSTYTETSNHNGTFTLAATGSSDLISGVMQLQFSDKTVTVAANGSENEFIALLYQGALGRTPDAAGLAGWEKIGAALSPSATQSLGLAYALSDTSGGYNGNLSIGAGFTQSAEFTAKYGSLTNAQFVTQLYANILNRAPDTAGFNGWMAQLSAGESQAHVLVGFADSQEAINNATLGYTGQSGTHPSWMFLT